jgi:Septum formation
VFGILAMKEVKRGAGTVSGKGMAVAGLVLGIVGLVVAVIFWVAVGFGLANSKDVFDLETGDCVMLPEDDFDQLGRVQVVDCTDAHDAEVFATGELDGGDEPYPGVDEVTALIQEECTPEFEDYVGRDFESSELEATTIYPQEEDWDTTQQYVCIAYLDGEELTESIADSDR